MGHAKARTLRKLLGGRGMGWWGWFLGGGGGGGGGLVGGGWWGGGGGGGFSLIQEEHKLIRVKYIFQGLRRLEVRGANTWREKGDGLRVTLNSSPQRRRSKWFKRRNQRLPVQGIRETPARRRTLMGRRRPYLLQGLVTTVKRVVKKGGQRVKTRVLSCFVYVFRERIRSVFVSGRGEELVCREGEGYI